jgi:hypothetical protein
METAVQDIREWLENDRWSKLVSDIKYVNRFANRLSNQDITELDVQLLLSELESVERQTSQVCEAVGRKSGPYLQNLKSWICAGWGSINTHKRQRLSSMSTNAKRGSFSQQHT